MLILKDSLMKTNFFFKSMKPQWLEREISAGKIVFVVSFVMLLVH